MFNALNKFHMKLISVEIFKKWLNLWTFWSRCLLRICLLVHIFHILIHSFESLWSSSRLAKLFFENREFLLMSIKRRMKDINTNYNELDRMIRIGLYSLNSIIFADIRVIKNRQQEFPASGFPAKAGKKRLLSLLRAPAMEGNSRKNRGAWERTEPKLRWVRVRRPSPHCSYQKKLPVGTSSVQSTKPN